MHEPHVMEAHGARAAGEGHRPRDLVANGPGIDGSAEMPLGVVIEDGPAMTARHHHEGTVVARAVVEHDPHREEIVVGVRIERQSWCHSTGEP